MNIAMNRSSIVALSALLLLGGCDQVEQTNASPEPVSSIPPRVDHADQARELARTSIIIDTHIDVPYRVHRQWTDVSQATAGGDFDYPRAVAGGLNASFMSIYTPAGLEAAGRSKEVTEELIDLVNRIVNESPDKFAIALSPADVEAHFVAGLISLPLGMENGSPLEGDLANLRYFYDRGIRYITLAHGLSNHLADSSYDANRQWGGLSQFGEEVVREMNRLGIMVDVSHLSDEAFWDIMDITATPVIASHSSGRHFTRGWERNIGDDMIARLADNGGVVMINFGSNFLTQQAQDYTNGKRAALDAYLEEHGVAASESLRDAFDVDYDVENGAYPYATLDDVVDHIDHIVRLVGIDHVGIGSDYDGVGDTLPIGLKDVSSYPNLVEGLLNRDYSEGDVAKILGDNLLRVWREVEAIRGFDGE